MPDNVPGKCNSKSVDGVAGDMISCVRDAGHEGMCSDGFFSYWEHTPAKKPELLFAHPTCGPPTVRPGHLHISAFVDADSGVFGDGPHGPWNADDDPLDRDVGGDE